eukprot:2531-Heterococcus_DN1.PRE.1
MIDTRAMFDGCSSAVLREYRQCYIMLISTCEYVAAGVQASGGNQDVWHHPDVQFLARGKVLRDLRRALPRRAVVCDDSSATAATATDTTTTASAASKGRHRGNTTAWAVFMRQMTQMGGVIEADPSNKLGHPCATLFIPPCSETVRAVTVTGETLPSGTAAATSSASGSSSSSSSSAAVRVLCDGEQLLSNSQDCIGCAAPQTAVPAAALHGAAQAVCAVLRQRGVCGYVTVTFVAFWDAKHNTQRMWATNLELGISNALAGHMLFAAMTSSKSSSSSSASSSSGFNNDSSLNHSDFGTWRLGGSVQAASSTLQQVQHQHTAYTSITTIHTVSHLSLLLHDAQLQSATVGCRARMKATHLGTVFSLVDSLSSGVIAMLVTGNTPCSVVLQRATAVHVRTHRPGTLTTQACSAICTCRCEQAAVKSLAGLKFLRQSMQQPVLLVNAQRWHCAVLWLSGSVENTDRYSTNSAAVLLAILKWYNRLLERLRRAVSPAN